MSHHSDDALFMAGTDSFWEPGNYKRTTKRTEDGFRLCNDLILLIQERAEIEKIYAKSLKNWAKKWNELIEKGPEYGTTEAAWKSVLIEAERTGDMHIQVRDQLVNDVVNKIKSWQKDNFHKSMMHLKEKKDFEDSFKKAQKPWSKLLAKVAKTKADYHTACKAEKSASNQERNASGDSSLSPDQVKKLQDKLIKCRDDMQKTKERYESALLEINGSNAKYMEDMTVIFEKCQEFEEKRLLFFKEMLYEIHGCLNIAENPELPKIYEEYRHTIQNADSFKDLKWWSNNHGVGMAMNWPVFEDYSEEFRDIIGVKSKKTALTENGITLVNQHKFNEELPDYTPEMNLSRKDKKINHINGEQKITLSNNLNTNEFNSLNRVNNNKVSDKRNGKSDNPFDNEHDNEWDDYIPDAFIDNGEPGVPVRALYDYKGAEEDELTFQQGDIFEKLEDEDEQGWSKGRKDGKIGLYPANYVETI